MKKFFYKLFGRDPKGRKYFDILNEKCNELIELQIDYDLLTGMLKGLPEGFAYTGPTCPSPIKYEHIAFFNGNQWEISRTPHIALSNARDRVYAFEIPVANVSTRLKDREEPTDRVKFSN